MEGGHGGGRERAQQGQGAPAGGQGLESPGHRRQEHVEQELLVAETVAQQAEARPGQLVDEAFVGIGAGDGEMVVGVGVVEGRAAVQRERAGESQDEGQEAPQQDGAACGRGSRQRGFPLK